ncbi:MAG TPA: TIGR00300 family protein [Planctomycetia bacterium]|nr:TIGR00300 family protein [Planctomycetia bacterium]
MSANAGPSERIRLEGHIIDSLILPKVLDIIVREGGRYEIADIAIGQRREDPSWAEITVHAPDEARLETILRLLTPHGAASLEHEDCKTAEADVEGAFPEDFASTTNMETEVRVAGHWIPVDEIEMDCGIAVAADGNSATCVPMHKVKRGDRIVVGRVGVKVRPIERGADDPATFQFMASAVSSEKPKGVAVRDIAQALRTTKAAGKKILFVGGPAIVHTGGGEHLCRLIRAGYVQILFAGNALATHDIEQALYRTSLGVDVEKGVPAHEGHEHHLRAINTIRRAGNIRKAVESGVLKRGIMYECVKHGVEFLLAGSIRDDGPLPDVVTDSVVAQDRMRELRKDVGFCLMVATTLHSVATGNVLPASVRVACVDINPATATKLADRGTTQSIGIVSDAEPFLRILVEELLGAP